MTIVVVHLDFHLITGVLHRLIIFGDEQMILIIMDTDILDE